MHVRCPQCCNVIDLSEDDSLSDIECPSCGSHFHLFNMQSTTREIQQPEQLAHFRLIEQVGFGRFGTVWKARDEELDRIVAVKIPRREELDSQEAEQFLREARAVAQLQHPHIVSVHEVGRHEATIYIVSDYIDGPNLSEWLSGQRVTPREAATICGHLADALHHAHKAGVVHRDLKPSNVLMDSSGKPYLVDFGLAKRDVGELTITVDGRILGTPAYMPPEQARGEGHSADGRSDIYSLGVILFELLTGQRPFRGEKRMLLHQILHDEPPSPRKLSSHVPYDLETICLKCLEKEPERRYTTAEALADDLRRFLAGKPIEARPISRMERFVRWSRRNPAVASLVLGMIGVLLISTVVSSLFALQAVRDARRADDQAAQVTDALYNSYLQEIRLTRALREQGYREKVAERIEDARNLNSPAVDENKLRRELISAMGDFVGFQPVLYDEFDAEALAIALSPDADELAVGFADGRVAVFDTSSHTVRTELKEQSGRIHALEFSPDGMRLTSADESGRVQSWNKQNEQWQLGAGFELDKAPEWLELSADGEILISVLGAQVQLWNVADGEFVRTLQTQPHWNFRSVAIDRSGELAAGGFEDTQTEQYGWAIWELDSGNLRESQLLSLGSTYENGIAFDGDAGRLAIGFDEGLLVVSTIDFQQQMFKRLDATKAVVFAPDLPLLAAYDIRGRITLWNVETGREVAAIDNWGEGTSRNWLAFSDDNKFLAAGNSDAVRLWNLAAATERVVMAGHPEAIASLTFDEQGNTLFSGGKDDHVRFWNANSGAPIGELDVKGEIQAIAVPSDESLIGVGSWKSDNNEQIVKLVDAQSRRIIGHFDSPVQDVNGLAFFTYNGRQMLAAAGDTGLAIWEVKNDQQGVDAYLELFNDLQTERSLYLVASPDGRWIAFVRDRKFVALWDVKQAKEKPIKAPAMNQGWHGLAFLSDNQRIVYVGQDSRVVVYNVVEDKLDFRLGTQGQFRTPHIAVTRDGKWLAAMVDTDTVSVWNLPRREHVISFRPEGASVWALAWSPGGRKLAVGRNDGGIAIWDLDQIDTILKQHNLSPVR